MSTNVNNKSLCRNSLDKSRLVSTEAEAELQSQQAPGVGGREPSLQGYPLAATCRRSITKPRVPPFPSPPERLRTLEDQNCSQKPSRILPGEKPEPIPAEIALALASWTGSSKPSNTYFMLFCCFICNFLKGFQEKMLPGVPTSP